MKIRIKTKNLIYDLNKKGLTIFCKSCNNFLIRLPKKYLLNTPNIIFEQEVICCNKSEFIDFEQIEDDIKNNFMLNTLG